MSDTPDSTTIMIMFPDYEALKKEVEKLRAEVSMLYLELDELVFQECKYIEMAYMLAVGALEYKVYELECLIRKQKRKVEMLQAKKNRQEKINISEIDTALEVEFAEYKARLEKLVQKMNDALEYSRADALTSAESRELKKLYRAIVKALHPDLHPDLTDVQMQLFYNAVKAYENCDLNSLRIISTMVTDSVIPDQTTDTLGALVKEKERLSALLQSIKNKIAEIKSNFPYTMKGFVNSPEMIAARKIELQEKINQLTEVFEAYRKRINEMLR